MIRLTIHHKTTYRFHKAVTFWPHRLMLRPRESRDLRLISSNISITPDARVTWAQDVFGNAVAMASFMGVADRLIIDSVAELELGAVAWPVFEIAAEAASYPFRYSDDDWADLGGLAALQYPDPQQRLFQWARSFVRSNPTDTLALLKDVSAGVSESTQYQSREDEGTQSPVETLDRRFGSCRDFAVLFAEAARTLGFGARIVSGYLYNPDQDRLGSSGAGSTHAWAEIYVPGAGWITFDPTNRSVGSFNLIPVAVVRHIRQAMPVAGKFRRSDRCVCRDVRRSLGLVLDGRETAGRSGLIVIVALKWIRQRLPLSRRQCPRFGVQLRLRQLPMFDVVAMRFAVFKPDQIGALAHALLV